MFVDPDRMEVTFAKVFAVEFAVMGATLFLIIYVL